MLWSISFITQLPLLRTFIIYSLTLSIGPSYCVRFVEYFKHFKDFIVSFIRI